jgi:hypothetical protein
MPPEHHCVRRGCVNGNGHEELLHKCVAYGLEREVWRSPVPSTTCSPPRGVLPETIRTAIGMPGATFESRIRNDYAGHAR